MKKCPYCGRRISYFTAFHEKKHGLYKCSRCKKESKIKTDFRLIVAFAAICLLVILFMIVWNSSEYYNSFWGVIITVAILCVFYFLTPLFIRFVPLRKYVNSPDEGRKSDRVSYEDDPYEINRDAFNEVRRSRRSTSGIDSSPTRSAYVPIIEDVSEAHSSSDTPLKRVHTSEKPSAEEYEPEEVKTYVPRSQKSGGSRYTGNRRL